MEEFDLRTGSLLRRPVEIAVDNEPSRQVKFFFGLDNFFIALNLDTPSQPWMISEYAYLLNSATLRGDGIRLHLNGRT